MASVVSVTGATGFIGSAVVRRLLVAGIRVRALVRSCSTEKCWGHPGLEWIKGQLGDLDSLQGLIKGSDAVIHCAGLVRGIKKEDFERINSEAVKALAELCSIQPCPPRFLLISSLAARHPELSFYALSKKKGEEALTTFSARLSWTILRPPAVYGPGDRELRPVFRCIRLGVLPCLGAGSNRFSLLHVHDMEEAVLSWFNNSPESGQIYELHDGVPGGYSWDDVAALAERIFKRRLLRLRIPFPVLAAIGHLNLAMARLHGNPPMLTPGKARELAYPDWVCDNTRIRQDTGWAPRIMLKDALVSGMI